MTATSQILQLDVQGTPQTWISYEKAAYYYSRKMIAWEVSSEKIVLHGGISKLTGQQSILELSSIIALSGRMSHKQNHLCNYLPISNRTLFRRDSNMCAYCGRLFSFDNLTRDHIMPKSRGGLDVWTNIVSCCSKCNRFKGNKTPEEANLELLFLPYVPVKSEHLILSNRYILQDQMQYLLNRIPDNSRIKQKYTS